MHQIFMFKMNIGIYLFVYFSLSWKTNGYEIDYIIVIDSCC